MAWRLHRSKPTGQGVEVATRNLTDLHTLPGLHLSMTQSGEVVQVEALELGQALHGLAENGGLGAGAE